jgi:hypothetical protein
MSNMKFGKIGATPSPDRPVRTEQQQNPQQDLSALSPAPNPITEELSIRPHSQESVRQMHRSGHIGETSMLLNFTTAA